MHFVIFGLVTPLGSFVLKNPGPSFEQSSPPVSVISKENGIASPVQLSSPGGNLAPLKVV